MSSRSLRRNRRKIAASALAATLGLAGLGLAAPPAGATPDFDLERLAGTDRIETAVEISEGTFESSADALLARADLYPDALAGNYLAGAVGAPILLSHTDEVPPETLDELERLGAETVHLLGGTAALSDDVADALEAAGFTVNRVAGDDRYETAREVAVSQDAETIGDTDDGRTALLATGENFADALAGGPLAYAGSHPLLLTPSATLSDHAGATLEQLGVEHVLILGGTAAISQGVEDAVEDLGMTTERLAGGTRYSTATEIAEYALTQGFSDEHADVATGRTFPDALTGGPHAGENMAPILLANEGNTTEACAYLTEHSDTVSEGHVFGGTAAVSTAAEEILEACGQGEAVEGAVSLASTTVQQGGTLTGTVEGAVQSLRVSGCGLSDQPVGVSGADNSFAITLPESQAAGECELLFTITRPGGAVETQTIDITVTTPEQFTLGQPFNTMLNPASTGANPNQGRELYTFTFPAAFQGPVDVALVPAGNLRINSEGQIEFRDVDDNNRADNLGQCGMADIELIDGVDPVGGNTQYVNNQAIPADRTLEVSIDSTQPTDACTIVVFRDANNDNQLSVTGTLTGDTVTDGVPTEAFGIAGVKIWYSSEAAFGTDTIFVATKGDLVPGDNNNALVSFQGPCPTANAAGTAITGGGADATAQGTLFEYDANDVFQINGVGTTLENFERLAGTCDQVQVSYNPDPTGVSTFNLVSEVNYLAPGAASNTPEPTFTAVNADGGATPNDVRVRFTVPALNNPDAIYEIQRASTAGPDNICGTADDITNPANATFTTVLSVTQVPGDNVSRVIPNNPDGCYFFRVEVTNPVTGNDSRSAVAGPVLVPGAPDTGAPRIVQSSADDQGLPGRLDAGDVISLLFSETVQLANGDSIVIQDGDGEEYPIVLGTGNTYTTASRGGQTLLTITVTQTPAGPFVDRDGSAANNDGLIEYNGTAQNQTGLVITNSQGINDPEGNLLGIPGNNSDRVIEADEITGGTAGDDTGRPLVSDIEDTQLDDSTPDPTDNQFIVCYDEAIDAASATSYGPTGANAGTIVGGGSYTVRDVNGFVNPVTNAELVPAGTMTDPDGTAPATLSVPNPNSATFDPIAYSANATCVRITTANDLGFGATLDTRVRDLAGNAGNENGLPVTDPAPVPDTTAPEASVTQPNEGDTTFEVVFTEPLDPATVQNSDFSYSGGTVTLFTTADNVTYTVTVDTAMDPGDTVGVLANSVADPAGNVGPTTNRQQVVPNNAGPTITSATITDNDGDSLVSNGDVIVLTFNEAMNTSCFSGFSLLGEDGISGYIDPQGGLFGQEYQGVFLSPTQAQLTMISDPENGVIVHLPAILNGLDGGSTGCTAGFQDVDGNIVNLGNSTDVTLEDPSDPTATVTPSCENPSFTVDFNEPIDATTLQNSDFTTTDGVITGFTVIDSDTVVVSTSNNVTSGDTVGINANSVSDTSGNSGPAANVTASCA